MSTSRILHSLICIALVRLACATDRVVDPALAGGYPTITTAVAAAVDGDRILVPPATYIEGSITIDKSIEIICATEGSTYTLYSELVITAAYGRKITVSSADVHGILNSTTIGSATTGCTLNLLLCSFDHVDLAYTGIFLNAFHCTVRGQMGFSQGNLAGNTILGDPLLLPQQYSPLVFTGAGTTEETFIVGNVIGSSTWEGGPTMVMFDTHAPLHFSNNLVHWTRASPNSAAIQITSDPVDGITTAGVALLNNTIRRTIGTTQPWLSETVPDNAVFFSTLSSNFLVGATAFVPGGGTSNVFTSTFNVLTSNVTFAPDPVTGMPQAGSPAINAGDPDVTQLDLDLSRNDAGCYGGSFSRANFSAPGTPSTSVGLVFAPRRSGQLTPMPFTAIGFDR